MVCIYCGSTTQVTNSRHRTKTNEVWRRRLCLSCQAIFTTQESASLEGSVSVKDKLDHLQPFERDKLFLSIVRACGHRKDSTRAATALTSTVISQLLPQIKNATLLSQAITQTTGKVLNRFDKAAGVQYSAYHQT